MKSILTPFQKAILEGICQEKFITENFVFGGGTALSEFYLKHRYSEDFDFFTENEIPLEEIRIRLDKLCQKLGIKSVEYREIQSSKIFFLKSGPKEVVKTDFNYFPFPHFGQAKIYKKLRISSLLDIAISKLDTILTRSKARDFVDFYFIQKEHSFPLDFLLKKIEEKFSWKIDPLFLGSRFLKVNELKDYPRIIKSFSHTELIAYFTELAKDQRKKIVKL